MQNLKVLMIAGAASAAALATVPAHAVVTTFATYSAVGGANVRLVNNGTGQARTSNASIYTTSTPTGTAPGGVLVNFSFLQAALAPFVTNVSAVYTLDAQVPVGAAAINMSGLFLQPGLNGTFSFLSAASILVSGPGLVTTTYAAGSNLLSGSFVGGSFAGSGTSGSSFASGPVSGGSISFTSDFLDFTGSTVFDRSQSLTAVTPNFAIGANGSLSGFRAVAGGQFSADPEPIITTMVPEPESWALLIAGFGLVGAAARRRRRISVVA
jgi:hypothetical protein